MLKTILLLIYIIIGLITAHFAKKNKRNPYIWFFIGMLFGIWGLITMFLLNLRKIKKAKKELKKPVTIEDPRYWYYLDEDKKRYGPISLNRLKGLLEENKIFSNTYVWNEDFKNWEFLKNIKEFSLLKKNLPTSFSNTGNQTTRCHFTKTKP